MKKNDLDKNVDSFFTEWSKQHKEGIKMVSSKNYFDWFVDILNSSDNNVIHDNDWNYSLKYSEIDCNNLKVLHYFQMYLLDLSYKFSIFFEDNSEDNFEKDKVIFKYKNNFYEVKTILGQGCYTFGIKLKDIPEKYLDLDLELIDKLNLKDYELFHTIVFNKQAILSTVYLINQISELNYVFIKSKENTLEFKKWNESGRKNKILIANSESFNLLKHETNARVNDENTILTLGLKTKKELNHYYNDLEELK